MSNDEKPKDALITDVEIGNAIRDAEITPDDLNRMLQELKAEKAEKIDQLLDVAGKREADAKERERLKQLAIDEEKQLQEKPHSVGDRI